MARSFQYDSHWRRSGDMGSRAGGVTEGVIMGSRFRIRGALGMDYLTMLSVD